MLLFRCNSLILINHLWNKFPYIKCIDDNYIHETIAPIYPYLIIEVRRNFSNMCPSDRQNRDPQEKCHENKLQVKNWWRGVDDLNAFTADLGDYGGVISDAAVCPLLDGHTTCISFLGLRMAVAIHELKVEQEVDDFSAWHLRGNRLFRRLPRGNRLFSIHVICHVISSVQRFFNDVWRTCYEATNWWIKKDR